jgi:hypothetical protein
MGSCSTHLMFLVGGGKIICDRLRVSKIYSGPGKRRPESKKGSKTLPGLRKDLAVFELMTDDQVSILVKDQETR